MKIRIPTNKGITVRQYVEWMTAKTDIDRMKVITGWPEKKILGLKPETMDKTIELYSQSINDPSGEFIRSFVVRKNFRKKEIALIPNFESMKASEYISTDEMVIDIFERKRYKRLPELLAVLYRPVKNRLGDWYTLEPYDTDKVPHYIEYINEMSLYHVNGLLAFFLTFAVELSQDSIQSLKQTTEKILNQTEIRD